MTTHPLTIYRSTAGLSMKAMAMLSGTTRVSIFRIEKGRQWPSLALVRRLISASEGKLSANDFLPPEPNAAVTAEPSGSVA